MEEKKEDSIQLSDAVWAVPEVGLKEFKSCSLLVEALEKEGFFIERQTDGIETAFTATWGEGKPVIGLLAEYDALPGLSQQAGVAEKIPLAEGTPGHSWKVTSQVGSSITHKALICAAKTMALATIMCFDQPEVVEQAKKELNGYTGGRYCCPVEMGRRPVNF